MSWIELPNSLITDFLGYPVRLPVRDDDGDVIWENPTEKDPEKKLPKTEPATVEKLIREILLGLNGNQMLRGLIKPRDSEFAQRLSNQIHRVKDGVVRVRDQELDWLHRLLERDVPVNKEAKDAGYESQTILVRLYGLSGSKVKDYLTDPEKKRLDSEEEGDTDGPAA